eukprot:1688419-Pyramimonas_sp.AAC.1
MHTGMCITVAGGSARTLARKASRASADSSSSGGWAASKAPRLPRTLSSSRAGRGGCVQLHRGRTRCC